MWDGLPRILVCPTCHGPLDWHGPAPTEHRIREGKARCSACRTDFPVHAGIGAFLPSPPGPEDLWESVDRETAEFLAADPGRARRLLDEPFDRLGPTDLLVRAMVHDAHGDFGAAKAAADRAEEGLYTPEYLAASRGQMRHLQERLEGRPGPVVDLASGRGSLLEFLLPGSPREWIGTDLSTRVLLRDRRYFDFLGLGSRLSLLAFDARRTPFADRSVPTLVTNLGLANIADPGTLLHELRRVVSGELLAITLFYPDREGPNAEEIRRLKLDPLLYRDSALRAFEAAGFSVEVSHPVRATARPTPPGVLLPEVRPDRLPVVETPLEWCTLVAT